MRNPISYSAGPLRTQAEDAIRGLKTHEASLGIKQNTEAAIKDLLDNFDLSENAYQAARVGKLDATKLQRAEDKKVKEFISLTRDRLKQKIGTKWSQGWVEVGFISNNSLKLPGTLGRRQSLLMAIKAYLASHADYQVGELDITPEEAVARHAALANARGAVNGCRSIIALAKGGRDKALKALRAGLNGLIAELKQKLPGDDGRWRAFGFNPPAAVRLPARVTNLVVNPAGAGHLLAAWPHAALAERYRIYRFIVGVDTDYVLVKTVGDLETNVNSMASGQLVRLRVSAVNDAGEGQLSDPVEQTVP